MFRNQPVPREMHTHEAYELWADTRIHAGRERTVLANVCTRDANVLATRSWVELRYAPRLKAHSFRRLACRNPKQELPASAQRFNAVESGTAAGASRSRYAARVTCLITTDASSFDRFSAVGCLPGLMTVPQKLSIDERRGNNPLRRDASQAASPGACLLAPALEDSHVSGGDEVR